MNERTKSLHRHPLTDSELEEIREYWLRNKARRFNTIGSTAKYFNRHLGIVTYVLGTKANAHECMLHLSSRYRSKWENPPPPVGKDYGGNLVKGVSL